MCCCLRSQRVTASLVGVPGSSKAEACSVLLRRPKAAPQFSGGGNRSTTGLKELNTGPCFALRLSAPQVVASRQVAFLGRPQEGWIPSHPAQFVGADVSLESPAHIHMHKTCKSSGASLASRKVKSRL